MDLPNIHTDADGLLRGLPVHDATLQSFSYSRTSGVIEMGFRCIDSSQKSLRLQGVDILGIVGLRDGAIVNRIHVWSTTEVRALSPGGALRVLFAGDLSGDHLLHERERLASRNDGSLLVWMTCSYGGEFAAVCQSVDILSDAGTD